MRAVSSYITECPTLRGIDCLAFGLGCLARVFGNRARQKRIRMAFLTISMCICGSCRRVLGSVFCVKVTVLCGRGHCVRLILFTLLTHGLHSVIL